MGIYTIVVNWMKRSGSDQDKYYARKRVLKGIVRCLKGIAESSKFVLEKMDEPASKIGGYIAIPLSVVSTGRNVRKGLKTHIRITILEALLSSGVLTAENKEIAEYALEKNKKRRLRTGTAASTVALGLVGLLFVPATAGISLIVTTGIGGVSGGALGFWSLGRWIDKKYTGSKQLRELRELREIGKKKSGKIKGMSKDIISTFTRGKSKIGEDLQAEGETDNELKKRENMARKLLKNAKSPDMETKNGALAILSALLGSEREMNYIITNPTPDQDPDILDHVKQKMRSTLS
jgi:hypothetical protein